MHRAFSTAAPATLISAGHHHLLTAAKACLRMGVPASTLVLLIVLHSPARAIARKPFFILSYTEAFYAFTPLK